MTCYGRTVDLQSPAPAALRDIFRKRRAARPCEPRASALAVPGRLAATPSLRRSRPICLGQPTDSRYTVGPSSAEVLPRPEPSVRSNTTWLLVRNFSHLAIGQIASTALGILLSALL